MRLTEEERAFLAERCGGRPWASYIRERVFGEQANTKRRAIRRPTIQDKALVASLAGLGESRLASNLNQLARHANTGTLDVTRETERELEEAYKAILAMRDALFMALGLKSSGA
ncbi:MAG: hypothetical protein Tsb002_03810 [Wenzhouxiangellaceae bacterium]